MIRMALIMVLLFPAAAAAEWSTPEPVESQEMPFSPRLAVSSAGTQFVLFGFHEVGEPVGLGANSGFGTTWAAAFTGPVTYGRNAFALAWTGLRERSLYAEVGDRARRVATGRRLRSPSIAANRRGDVALAWFDDRGTRNDAVYVAVRRPGGRLGRPRLMGRGRVRSATVAVGARGEVLVAWAAFGKVRVRRLGASAQTIHSHEAFGARLQARFAAGRAMVGWVAKFRSEGGDARDTFVEVAQATGRRFGRARLLARHAGDEGALRIDERGRAVWSTPDGIFVDGAPIAPAGARLEDAEGAVVWTRDGLLYADGEEVGGPGASEADATIDPLTGRPVVVWEQGGGLFLSSRG